MKETMRLSSRLLASALLCVAFAGAAGAAPVEAPGAFKTFMATATGVGQYTVGFGSGGTPILSPGVPTIHTAGATPIATFTGMFPAASGARVPITAVAKIEKAAVVAAVGRLAGAVVPVLGLSIGLYQLATELDFLVTGNTGGVPKFSKVDKAIVQCAPSMPDPGMTNVGGEGGSQSWGCKQQGGAFFWGYTYNQAGGPQQFYPYYGPVPGTIGSTITDATYQQFVDAVAARSGWPSTSAIAQALADSAAANPSVKIETEAPTVTGPAAGPPSVSTNSKPSTTGSGTDLETKTCTPQYVYSLAVINTKEACVTTLKPPTGATVTTSTTSAPKPADSEKVIVCGLPDTPACKIDETGTPEAVQDEKYKSKLDDYQTKQNELKEKVSGVDDKSFFSGWGHFFVTPPVMACVPYTLPRDMGVLDPCPVVEGMRSVMAFAWACTALISCLGMIKKVVA